jgi:excisionase family DNA binding protein
MQHNAKPSKSDTSDVLIKKPEVYGRLAISKRKLDYMIAQGRISFVRIGGSVRFVRADVEKLIRSNRIPAK